MTTMIAAPAKTPMVVPSGPAFGRNTVPGMTSEPQPTAVPNANAQAASGERCREKNVFFI